MPSGGEVYFNTPYGSESVVCNLYDKTLKYFITNFGDTFYSPEFRQKFREQKFSFLEYGSYFEGGDKIPNIILDIKGEESRFYYNIIKYTYIKKKGIYQQSHTHDVLQSMKQLGLSRREHEINNMNVSTCIDVTAEDLLNHPYFKNSIVIFSLCLPKVANAVYAEEIRKVFESGRRSRSTTQKYRKNPIFHSYIRKVLNLRTPYVRQSHQIVDSSRNTYTSACFDINYNGMNLKLDFSLEHDERFVPNDPEHNIRIIKDQYPNLYDKIIKMPLRDGKSHDPTKCLKVPITLAQPQEQPQIISTVPKTFIQSILEYFGSTINKVAGKKKKKVFKITPIYNTKKLKSEKNSTMNHKKIKTKIRRRLKKSYTNKSNRKYKLKN